MSGETAAACEAYRAAARRATNLPQQRYLIGRAHAYLITELCLDLCPASVLCSDVSGERRQRGAA